MTFITKWSLVRATKKRMVDDIIKSGRTVLCIYNKYLAFLLYCCLSINFVCLLLNENALRNETSAVMNYITQLK
jgi:hypothetical protein